MGPKIEPCGTPEDTGRLEEIPLPILTDWEPEERQVK